MAKKKSFFLSKFEEFERDHPERFKKVTRTPRPKKTFDCEGCGLKEKCLSGRIERYGKGGKEILGVGLCPGKEEDAEGVPFIGPAGEFLRSSMNSVGINLYKDCVRTNIVQCAIRKESRKGPYYSTPTDNHIKCCKAFLEKDILEVKPKLIICFGGPALNAVLPTDTLKKFTISKVHGKVFPSHKRNCWVGASFHPSHIIRGNRRDSFLFCSDLINILEYLDEPLPKPLTKEGNILIQTSEGAIELLRLMSESTLPVSFDYETTTLSSFDEKAEILTVSLCNVVEAGYCIHLNNPDWTIIEQAHVYHELKQFLLSNVPKVIQNTNMEELWGRNLVGAPMNNLYWDTMVSSHVLNCRSGTTSLGFQVFEMTGHEYKEMVDIENLEDESIEDLSDYNNWDSRYTLMSYYKQETEMDENQKQFNRLLHESLPALANMKERGIRMDGKVFDDFQNEYTKEIEVHLYTMLTNPGVVDFERRYDKEFNADSPKQLGEVLYDFYQVPSVKKTKTGECVDEETLGIISSTTKDKEVKEFLTTLLRFRKISGFLAKIEEYRREMDPNGFIHPSYNLNIAESFRSSANNPQVHNVYKRVEEFRRFRKAFIPRPGNFFLEVDYDGLEVRVIGMASGDGVLIEQIIKGMEWDKAHPGGGANPYDTHRRWGARIYQKDFEIITTKQRYNSKNQFIFPNFYGSLPGSICRSFPEISSKHIERVVEEFWEEYSGVKGWQNSVLDFYARNGYVTGMSGFKRPGPLSDNQLLNTPIQGPAFHLLLDALWKLDEEMIRRGMKSMMILEVHDSILFDTYPPEMEEVMELAEEILCSKRFDWQKDVPLSVSWEMGENWFEMSEI